MLGRGNWVRFAYLDRGAGWGRGKLGSFRIVGAVREPPVRGLGLFR